MVAIVLGRNRWTKEQQERIVELHKAGMTPLQLAERYDVSRGSINGVLQRNKNKGEADVDGK